MQAKAASAGGQAKVRKERGLLGLGASDFEAFQNAKAAVERREKEIAEAKARSTEIEKERDAAKARFEKALKEKETVEKEIAGETVKRDEAGRIKRISPAEKEKAEQVNQAAPKPQPQQMVQYNDNSQQSRSEQKTVIEENKELNTLTNDLTKQIEILKSENEYQKSVIQQHNLDQEELEFLRLNLIYSSRCQSKKLFSTGFRVGTEEYKECIMRKGKISD